jgi:hypothetical protein
MTRQCKTQCRDKPVARPRARLPIHHHHHHQIQRRPGAPCPHTVVAGSCSGLRLTHAHATGTPGAQRAKPKQPGAVARAALPSPTLLLSTAGREEAPSAGDLGRQAAGTKTALAGRLRWPRGRALRPSAAGRPPRTQTQTRRRHRQTRATLGGALAPPARRALGAAGLQQQAALRCACICARAPTTPQQTLSAGPQPRWGSAPARGSSPGTQGTARRPPAQGRQGPLCTHWHRRHTGLLARHRAAQPSRPGAALAAAGSGQPLKRTLVY